jgi:alanyl-tRNA synthetase
MGIYQGGVPPGKELRIVEIPGVDVECCGGSHLDNTKETGMIKIIKSSKISDGIVRLEYTAGKAAQQEINKESAMLDACAKFLGVKKSQVPGRALEIFTVWKDVVKKGKMKPKKFTSITEDIGTDKDLLEKTASTLKTQHEHVLKTLQRFMKEIDGKING